MVYLNSDILHRRRRPLAWLLAGLAALPLLTLAMVGFLVWRSASDVTDGASDRLTASARIIAVEAKRIVGSTLARLDRFLVGRPVKSLMTGAAPTSTSDVVQGLFGFVLVFDAQGHIVAENVGETQAGISERDYFKSLQGGADWAISGLIEQSVFGEPVFAVARRLSVDNAFAGAAVMYIPADILVSSLPSLDLGEQGSLALYRSDGVLITRYPPDANAPLSIDAARLALTSQGAAPFFESAVDGSPRLTALASDPSPAIASPVQLRICKCGPTLSAARS